MGQRRSFFSTSPGATPTMVLNAASYWIGQGDAAKAAERVRAIDITALPVVDQAHRHLNLASALLSCGGDEAGIEALLVAAEAALDEAASDPYATAWRVCVHNSRGDLALRRGDAAGALQHFQAALAGGASYDAATHRRVGDAMHAMQDDDGARQAWTSALAAAHPDTPLAAQLRARLGS